MRQPKGCALAVGLAAALATGCGIELGGATPWQRIGGGGTSGAMTAEMSPDEVFRSARPSARPAQGEPLRIVSYNTEFGQDPAGLADALLSDPELSKTSVFLFQEEECYPDEPRCRAADLAERLGLGYIYVPGRIKNGGTHGLAIMSAFPIENAAKMDLPLASNGVQRIALAADIVIGERRLHVINVHLETRLNPRDRIEHLHPAVLDAPGEVVIAGDFNTNWITWAGGVPVLANERDQAPIIDSYMDSMGFALDSERSGPTESAFGLEFRLDSIYTRGLDATFGGVVRTGPSDHWPLYIDVRL